MIEIKISLPQQFRDQMNSVPQELLVAILSWVHDPLTLMVAVPSVCKGWKAACAHLDVHLDFTFASQIPAADIVRVCGLFPSAGQITCKSANDGAVAAITSCRALTSIDLSLCRSVCNASLKALSLCVRLEVANFRGCSRITDDGIATLAAGCMRLTSIDVSSCEQVGDPSLKSLAAGCSGLRRVDFSWCVLVSEAGDLAAGCIHLEDVNFDRCYLLGNSAPEALAEHCSNLQQARFHNCTQLTDEGMVALAQGCSLLTTIDCGSCVQLTDKTMRAVATSCHSLTHINVEGCRLVTDEGVAAVAEACTGLVFVNLADCGVSDVAVRALVACPDLGEVNLEFCENVTGAAVVWLKAQYTTDVIVHDLM